MEPPQAVRLPHMQSDKNCEKWCRLQYGISEAFELIVLALHCGVEALVPYLVDGLAHSALLVTAHVRCRLVAWLAHLHRRLVVVDVVLRALARGSRVHFVQHEAVLAQHVLVR